MVQQEIHIHVDQLFGGNLLLSLSSCNYLLPTKVGLCGCQTVANFSDMVNRGLDCIFALGHNVYTFTGAMRIGSHVGWSFQHPTIPMGLKSEGWKVSFVLPSIHNFSVSVVKDTHGHWIGQPGEATNHQWMINIEVAAVLNVCFIGHF